jgi:hypothetical protein
MNELYIIIISLLILILLFLLVVGIVVIFDSIDIFFNRKISTYIRSIPGKYRKYKNVPKYKIGDTIIYNYFDLDHTCEIIDINWDDFKWLSYRKTWK